MNKSFIIFSLFIPSTPSRGSRARWEIQRWRWYLMVIRIKSAGCHVDTCLMGPHENDLGHACDGWHVIMIRWSWTRALMIIWFYFLRSLNPAAHTSFSFPSFPWHYLIWVRIRVIQCENWNDKYSVDWRMDKM